MAVASQGRAGVEHSLLEVCFLTQFGHLPLGFFGTLASGRTATIVIGDARDFDRAAGNPVILRAAHYYSVVMSKIFHSALESPPKPLLRTEQVAEKPHDSMGIRCVLSLSWRCWLLGLNDVVQRRRREARRGE
jgi:hypothetical protein